LHALAHALCCGALCAFTKTRADILSSFSQFNSHQWWHLLVVCGTLVHWSNCLLIYKNYLTLKPICDAALAGAA
jgi:predicted membrane channel-forming protein YqfA (hemolysin III family)